MNNLSLIKSEKFGNVECDIYSGGKEFYMTREQIGQALEYSDPNRSISKIHERKQNRLDKYSSVVKLTTVDGKKRDVTVYTRKGIMEICRHSSQPKADAFMDWVWDIMDSLMTGKTKLVGMTEYQRLVTTARMANAKAREASLLLKIADRCKIGEYVQVLHSKATEILTGQALIPLPEAPERTYSAEDIGKLFGISKQMVGRLANAHSLKTAQYGKLFYDKAKYADKQVESWRYFASVIPQFEKILGMTAS